ncbi:MAG TPA: hypothetical protein VI078_12040 [bacterium]
MKRFLLGCAALVLAAAPARAAGLSFTGETGLGRSPLAITAAPGTVTVAADYVASTDTFVPVRAELGLIEGVELGANYWYTGADNGLYGLGVNAKFATPLELVENLNVAAGVGYQSFSGDAGFSAASAKAYGVLSYTWQRGITLIPSAGVSYEIQGGEWDEFGARVFASVLVKPVPALEVGAEFVLANEDLDGQGADQQLWFGARFSPRENLAVQAGAMNMANVGGGGDQGFVFHAGVQYVFTFAR